MSLDAEIRAAERHLGQLYARAGFPPLISKPLVVRPDADYELSPEPVNGEEITFVFRGDLGDSPKVMATGGYAFVIVGVQGESARSNLNGFIRARLDNTSYPSLIRLMALTNEKIWTSIILRGTWTVDA